MSHFTVLVIGKNPEEQLKPFDENLKVDYKDESEEYKNEYETKKVSEFFCASSSSWGMHVTQELFENLKKSKVGRIIVYEVTKIDTMRYFKQGSKYRGHYALEDGKRCKGNQWFEVEKVLETTHPEETVCFEGKIRLRKISAPKQIALKDKYPVYEDYLKEWHGVKDMDKQGYSFNPKAKWDWYQLGGRWSGFFKLKPKANGKVGKVGIMTEPAKPGYVDQAYKRDIDFEKMVQENFEEAAETYNKFEEEYIKGDMKPGSPYFDYGVENVGDADHYFPENRESFLKKRAEISTFAVLKDGEWYEKGNMGWWGCVSNEKDPDEWNDMFNKLLNELPDDTLLSLYDCHI
jgi:hypothetical protein